MISIDNIDIKDVSLKNSETKEMKKCIEILSEAKIDYRELLPKQNQYTIMIDMTGYEMPNVLRRTILEAIPIRSLSVSVGAINSDDNFIVKEYLKQTIELIPINQDIDIKELSVSLNVENKSLLTAKIFSHNMTITNRRTHKQIDTNELFASNICLTYLKSGKYLNIGEIKFEVGTSNANSGKFSAVENIYYDVLDYDFTIPSWEQSPKKYRLGYTTYGNIEPKKIMRRCCSAVEKKIRLLDGNIGMATQGEIYISDICRIEYLREMTILYILNDYRTLARLIARYCYLMDEGIDFVAEGIIHPSKNESMVKIIHGDSLKLLGQAIKKILSDLEIIRKPFE